MGVAIRENKMFKILRSANRSIVYFVSGRIDLEAVSELQRLLSGEPEETDVILDLGDARLVQAEAVEFLGQCQDVGIEIRNCPAYVREWIRSNRR